ncbi:hypothetical protein PTKIN_Ptkin18bG0078500 [Pterospermum kingtungense]
MALLVSYWWRINHNENSLVFKVLQSKYSHQIHTMKVKLGSNPSYIWRSLLVRRDVVEKVSI